MAAASVIALIVIAVNLLLTCGILVLCIFYLQKMIERFSVWMETGMGKGAAYAAKTAQIVDTTSGKIVEPVIWAEQKAEQLRETGRSVFSESEPRK